MGITSGSRTSGGKEDTTALLGNFGVLHPVASYFIQQMAKGFLVRKGNKSYRADGARKQRLKKWHIISRGKSQVRVSLDVYLPSFLLSENLH